MAVLAPRGLGGETADAAASSGDGDPEERDDGVAPSRPSPRDPRRLTSIATGLVAACAYVVLALLAYWPVQPFSTTKVVSCGCYDPVEQMWFLAWTPHAILHGINPFYTHALNVPVGANLAANTTMPLLGVLASPITLSLGPVAAYNVLIRLALCLSALSMCLVLRHYRLRWPVAFLGGLVYGFSPYMFAQGSLHLNLCFVPLLPLIAVAIDNLVVRDRHSTRRAGLTLGALATAQYFISSELLADLGVLAVVGAVVLAVRFPRRAMARARRVAGGVGWALVPFVLLASYPILFGLFGPEHYVKNWEVWHGDETIQNDLLSPLVPTPAELIAPSRWASLGAGLVGGVSENGGYLGIPLVVCWLAAAAWAAFKRNGLALLFAVLAPVAFLLSLGPALQIHGQPTGIWLPFAVSSSLPLLQLVVPARYSVLISICVIVTLAVAFDALWSRLVARSAVAPAAVEMSPADISAADISPAEVSAADVSAADVSPADVSPADVSPADVSPADVSAAARPGVVFPTAAQPGVALATAPQPGVALAAAAQHGIAQPGIAQHGIAQPGIAQHGIAQHGIAQPGIAQHGIAQHGIAQHGIAQPGIAQPGIAQPGIAQPGIAQPAVDPAASRAPAVPGAPPASGPPSSGVQPASGAPRARAARRVSRWLASTSTLPEVLATAALVVVALLPLLPAHAVASAPVDDPAYFSSLAVRATPSGSNVLVYPYPIEQDDFSMLWQATSGFRFNLLGGYILTPLTFNSGGDVPVVLPPATVQVILYAANGSSSWAKSSTLEQVFGATTPSNLHPARFATLQVKEFLDMYHVSTVIEDPARYPGPAAPGSPVAGEPSYQPDYYPQAITVLFTKMFGAPVHDGPLLIWYHADTRPVARGYR